MSGNNGSRTEKVRLELYAHGLKNIAGAFRGTSDPFAVVTLLANNPSENPKILGKTEVIKNSLNPRWTTYFDLDYDITKDTRINIQILDEVTKGQDKSMGSVMFEVGEVLGSRGNVKAKRLRSGGSVFARIVPAPADLGTIHLKFRGVGLKNVEGFFGKSDPFFELSTKADNTMSWHIIYRSKHIDNNLNPIWEAFSLSLSRLCNGDHDKPILFSLWDHEKKGKHTFMGSFEMSVNGLLHNVVSDNAKNVDTSKAFIVKNKGKDFGKIVVTTATIENGSSNATNAPVMPSQPAAPTEPAQVTTNPTSPDTPSFSQALDVPPPTFQNAAAAVSAANAFSNLSISESKPQSTPYKQDSIPSYGINAGDLPPPIAPPTACAPVDTGYSQGYEPMAAPAQRPKFVEYLSGGCELELSIAIDFTGSNGDPRRPGTLHYISPDGSLNDYEKAITAVGSTIARYDHDQRFPVFGFGAKYGGIIQHCFQVGNAPELDGLQSVLQAYRQVFRTGLTMSGPTVFAEVIDFAAAAARSQQENSLRIGKQSYRILLILTDGAVTDVEQTKRSIQAASDAPLSIVIVGIGNADFSAMHFLDDFQVPGAGGGRDICQFVEFSKYQHDKSALRRATLEEIPDQLVDYFYSRGIKPLPPVSGSQISLAPSEADEEDIDLNINISPEGEISLANYDGAVYDDTKFETYNSIMGGPSPNQPQAPYNPQSQQYAQPGYQQTPSLHLYGNQPSMPGHAPYIPQSQQNLYGNQPPTPGQSPYIPQSQQNLYGGQPPIPGQAPYMHNQGFQNNYQAYSPHQAPEPYRPNQGNQPALYNNSYSQQTAPYNQPAAPHSYQQGHGNQNASQPNSNAGSSLPYFYVQVPPNVTPGMQLRIQNPKTKQDMIVTIPNGVAPGGKFGVRY